MNRREFLRLAGGACLISTLAAALTIRDDAAKPCCKTGPGEITINGIVLQDVRKCSFELYTKIIDLRFEKRKETVNHGKSSF